MESKQFELTRVRCSNKVSLMFKMDCIMGIITLWISSEPAVERKKFHGINRDETVLT